MYNTTIKASEYMVPERNIASGKIITLLFKINGGNPPKFPLNSLLKRR